jgi:hypothetical protein
VLRSPHGLRSIQLTSVVVGTRNWVFKEWMPLEWSPPTQSTASSLPSTPQRVVVDGSNPTEYASRPPHVSEQQTQRNATYASDSIQSTRPFQDTDHQRERQDSGYHQTTSQQASHSSQNLSQHVGLNSQVHYQQPAVYAQPSSQTSASTYQGPPSYQSPASAPASSSYNSLLNHYNSSSHQPSTVQGTYNIHSSFLGSQEPLDPGKRNLLVALFFVRTNDRYSFLCP